MLHAQLGTLLENAQYLLADSGHSGHSLTANAGGAGGQYGYSRAIDGHHHVSSIHSLLFERGHSGIFAVVHLERTELQR